MNLHIKESHITMMDNIKNKRYVPQQHSHCGLLMFLANINIYIQHNVT